MEKKIFPIKEALDFGWKNTTGRLWFFVGIVLIIFGVSVLPGIIFGWLAKLFGLPILSLVGTSIGNIFSLIVGLGFLRIILDVHDGREVKTGQLFSEYRLFFKYFVGVILYSLIILGGMLLFIIPGIIWAIKFQFFAYALVDKKLGPIAALKESASITRGVKWNLFIFDILVVLVNMLGFALLFVGIFITIPLTALATVSIYRKLLVGDAVRPVPDEAVSNPSEKQNG